VEVRLRRAVERNKSMLYKAGMVGDGAYKTSSGSGIGKDRLASVQGIANGSTTAAKAALQEEEQKRNNEFGRGPRLEDSLSPQQIQMFEAEQEDMVKYFNSELRKIRVVEQSLTEISSLQTELTMNLEIQSESISQLVQDSISTTENVGSGNKELKRASERASTAQMVFWATCAFCTTLVVWDLIF